MASGSRQSLNRVGNMWIGKTREEKDATECISGTIQRMSRDFRRDRIPDSVIIGHLSRILKTARSALPRKLIKKKLSMSLNCTAHFGNHSAGWWKVWTIRLESLPTCHCIWCLWPLKCLCSWWGWRGCPSEIVSPQSLMLAAFAKLCRKFFHLTT